MKRKSRIGPAHRTAKPALVPAPRRLTSPAPELTELLSHRHHRAAEFLGLLLAVNMFDPEADLGGLSFVLEADKDKPVVTKPGEPCALDPGPDTENIGGRDKEAPAFTLPDLDAIVSDEPFGRQQVIRLRIVRMAAHVDPGHNEPDCVVSLFLLGLRLRSLPPQDVAEEIIHRLTIFLEPRAQPRRGSQHQPGRSRQQAVDDCLARSVERATPGTVSPC